MSDEGIVMEERGVPAAADYDSYWEGRDLGRAPHRYEIFLGWIERGSTVLDAGCGDGLLAERCIRELGCTVTGMDVSGTALGLAAGRGVRPVRGSLDAPLPFADGEFDYVIASEVLEHVVRSEEALRELHRVARRAVIVSVPNSAYWRHRVSLLAGRIPRQWIRFPWEHVRFWSRDGFRSTVEGLGMRVTRSAAGGGHPLVRSLWPAMFAHQLCFYIPAS